MKTLCPGRDERRASRRAFDHDRNTFTAHFQVAEISSVKPTETAIDRHVCHSMRSRPMTRRFVVDSHKLGGGSGIRTRDTVSRIHTFQACAFNHSATPPIGVWLDARLERPRGAPTRGALPRRNFGRSRRAPLPKEAHYSHDAPRRKRRDGGIGGLFRPLPSDAAGQEATFSRCGAAFSRCGAALAWRHALANASIRSSDARAPLPSPFSKSFSTRPS